MMEENLDLTRTQPAEPVVEQPKPANPWLKIASFSVLGLTVAITSFLLGRASIKPSPLSQALPTPTFAIPTPASDETVYTEDSRSANWKTYTNKKCRYEVKYPPSWNFLPEPEDAVCGAAVIFPYEVGSGIKPPDDWLKLQIGCADKETGRDPKNIVDQLNKRDTGYGVPKIEELEKITLHGNLVYKQINIPPEGESVLEYYIFPAGEKYYNLGFTPAENNPTIRNQILSTFKFLESQRITDTLSYYSGEVSPRVPYLGLNFLEIDVHKFSTLSAELTKDDYHYQDAVIDGYTFIANKGEDFEFLAEEDRQSNPGSFIETALYGWGPTVIEMGTRIGWGVPANTRYFYVVKGKDFYGPNYSRYGTPSFNGSKYGKYRLIITQRKGAS